MRTRQDLLNEVRRADSARDALGSCVVVIGVDRFSRVRGAIGYDLAENLISELVKRVAGMAEEPCVARLAPDAVGLRLDVGPTRSNQNLMLSEMLEVLEQPMNLQGHKVHALFKIGYASSRDGSESGEILLHQAEMALDQAREHSRAIQRFSIEEYGDPMSRLMLLDEMRDGLLRDEMKLHYQPQVRARTGETVAVEALIRWEHPTRGLVPPNHFIPTAEETGIIRELTEWVIARAIRDAQSMRRAGYDLRVGVNISSRLLCDPVFARNALALLETNIEDVTFEITESVAIDDWKMALGYLKQFADAGVRIAIDDYGSGMSSLAYVQQLPAQELKIDRQFVTQITDSHRDPLLVRSTIELGHALELEVVAEGIEDAETLALVTMMGCDIVQGYFIGMPMPLNELLDYMREGKAKEMVTAPLQAKMLWGQ